MGVDIHMYILDREGNIKKEEIYTGRNSEWFGNLRSRGHDVEYEHLPVHYNIPDGFKESARELEDDDYYDFCNIVVKDYKNWFETYRPDLDAGWVTKYEAWAYRTKNIIPEIIHYLSKDMRIEDAEFIEIENEYDNSRWLYNYVKKNCLGDDIIFYYFDC